MTRALALELGAEGIRVNAVAPEVGHRTLLQPTVNNPTKPLQAILKTDRRYSWTVTRGGPDAAFRDRRFVNELVGP